jgi:MFS family permease
MTSEQLLRKVSLRLLPFAIICYLFNYIDRINISIAKLPMSRDPALGNFNDRVFAVGAALFFIGYFVFEIPSNLLQQKVGARRWIARIMISWGIISACFLFTVGPKSFYALRLLLGLAEAGFFPGMILYLSYWIPQKNRARASAIFLTSTAIAGLVGNPLGGAILYFTQELPWLKPWQWLFLVEGIPTILLGLVALIILRDKPDDAAWLTPDEKTQLKSLLADEHRTHAAPHLSAISHAFASPKVWLLSLLYSLQIFGFYAINYWTPTLIKKTLADTGTLTSSTPPYVADLYTSLLSAIPFGAAAIGMILIGRSSDKRRERRYHLAFASAMATVGLSLAGLAPSLAPTHIATVLTIAGLSIGAVGAFGAFGPFWSLPSTLLTGTAAATAIALINSIGNLAGGAIGPPIIQALSLKWGLLLAGALAGCATVLILLVPLHPAPAER